jgi:hypothetical protein
MVKHSQQASASGLRPKLFCHKSIDSRNAEIIDAVLMRRAKCGGDVKFMEKRVTERKMRKDYKNRLLN